MPQITIYLEEEIAQKMADNAKAMKLSKSRWIANVIQEKLVDEWPDTVRQLPGSWDDFPSLAELRETGQSDIAREPL